MRKLCFMRPILWFLFPFVVVVLILWIGVEYEQVSIHWGNDTISTTTARAQHLLYHKDSTQKSEQDWDKKKAIVHTGPVHKSGKRHPDFKTFGWYPYWMGTAYKSMNFDLLWGISYFGYEVNPKTGEAKSVHFWNTTPLVDSAKTHGCNVYLSLINLGEKPNHQLLSNEDARNTLITSAVKQVANRKADGLVVDFEDVGKGDADHFSTFLVDLSTAMKKADPTYELIVSLYAENPNKVFDFETIDKHTDHYVMMGYEYSYAGSPNASANAPLGGDDLDLKSSVYNYLDDGVARSKFILALPYYGNDWNVKSAVMGAATTSFKKAPSYSQIVNHYDTAASEYDPVTMSKYLSYQSGGQWRQLWYDDAETLNKKQQWIIDERLAGMGIWALGYDHGTTALWKTIEKNFGEKQ